jgi:hypothetical protein
MHAMITTIATLATLELPMLIHLGASAALKGPADLQPILAEMQRIYDQSRIRIVPRIEKAQASGA